MENSMSLRSSTEDFIRVFEDNMSKHKTQKTAYEATEKEHERLTGNRRYSDFSSFARVRYRKLRRK